MRLKQICSLTHFSNLLQRQGLPCGSRWHRARSGRFDGGVDLTLHKHGEYKNSRSELHLMNVIDINLETARYYVVDDLPGAVQPSARLQSLLERFRLAKPITPLSLAFLQEQRLVALHKLVQGQVTYEAFLAEAAAERVARVERAETERVANAAAAEARDAEMREAYDLERAKARAELAARESDPRYVANRRNRELRSRYGVHGYVEQEHLQPLMEILRRADSASPLSEQELAWLYSVEEGEYFTQEIWLAHHKAEALALAADFAATGNPWSAINASSRFRKADLSHEAEILLQSVPVDRLCGSKVKSAFCTTQGGVLRDMGKLPEAKCSGTTAHTLMPGDYRPCTLLGAVCTEMGELQAGQDWFEKAVDRGAPRDSGDQELRKIFQRADTSLKKCLKEFLLARDSVRYAWVLK